MRAGGREGIEDLRGHFGNFQFGANRHILCNVEHEVTDEIIKPGSTNDLRGAVRFPLHLHVDLHDKGEGHSAETLDISAGGVLIHCGVDYAVGSTIQFSILMPAQAMGSPKDVMVECVGRVVRCSPAGNKVAVGAIIDEYRITR
jgi:PilZ domain